MYAAVPSFARESWKSELRSLYLCRKLSSPLTEPSAKLKKKTFLKVRFLYILNPQGSRVMKDTERDIN